MAPPPPGGSYSGSFRSVAEETAKHRERIDKLLSSCADAVPADQKAFYDDLFFLRFCMSNEDLAVAEHNVRETIKWRTQNKAALERCATGGPPPHNDIVGPYCVVGMHKQLLDGSPLQIIRSGLTNTPTLMEVATVEQVADWVLFQREEAFAVCDAVTRKTGIITKVVSINDFNHVSITAMDRRFFKSLGAASKASEVYYPQLVGMGVMINLPPWMNALMGLAKGFMSAKILSKIRPCPVSNTLSSDISQCPVASKILDPTAVPSFLGGKCGSPEHPHEGGAVGCVGNVPNARATTVLPRAAAGSTKLHVKARDSKEISVGRPVGLKGGKLAYTVTLNDTHVAFLLEEMRPDQSVAVLVPATKSSAQGVVDVAAGCELVARFEGKGWISGSDVEYRFEWME